MNTDPSTYKDAGVDTEGQDLAMHYLRQRVELTFELRPNEVRLPIGYFANVIDLGGGVGLAVSTDGVGTKILIAQMMDKYDTIGIDCVAMNVNDVLCVGAEPVALLDYIAVQIPHYDLLKPIVDGLYAGAVMAKVTIPGGEIAQVRDMIKGSREGYAFDLVATCVGTVPIDRILTGQETVPGDIVVGLRSSGIHSNGLTLARRILFDKLGWPIDKNVPELGRSIGEELLEPTRIYVRAVRSMIGAGLRVKALAHITSTGFLNLSRASAPAGYVLDSLPEPPPVFKLIQHCGNVCDAEMFFTYNMGIGFCVVVAPEDADKVLGIAKEHNVEAQVIGHTTQDADKKVSIPSYGLVGRSDKFFPQVR